MQKILIIILLLAIIGAFVSFENRASQDTILADEIHSLLEQGETQIELTKLTEFKFETINVFGPYTTTEEIEDSMEVQFKGDNGGIDILDDRFLLVFANEKDVVKTVVLSREYGDYTLKDNKLLIVE